MILTISSPSSPQIEVILPANKTILAFGSAGQQGIQGPQGIQGITGSPGTAEFVRRNVAQTAHGFTVGNAIRIQNSATTYIKAQANNVINAEVVGIVSVVIDANNFTIVVDGYVTGLSGLTKGTVYFLSDTTPGLLTSIEPTPNGVRVSKPLLIADSTTSGYLTNHRGFVKYA